MAGRSATSGDRHFNRHLFQAARHIGRQRGDRRRRHARPPSLGQSRQSFNHICFDALLAERPRAGEQFPQHHGQRINVAAAVEIVGLAIVIRVARLELLRRHVGQAAAEIGSRRSAIEFRAEADVEVGQLWNTVGIEQHVGRLYVAVQHALPMRIDRGPRQAVCRANKPSMAN